MSEENGSYQKDEIYSKSVRAGKRTYFFDVKSTRGNDLYLTITESKRRYNDDGSFRYEKHKLFLYKEDFEKFQDGFSDALAKIKELQATEEYEVKETYVQEPSNEESNSAVESSENSFTDVSFEDLDKE
jgi:single-stranded DNA-specific DHH superfamily exonuclease